MLLLNNEEIRRALSIRDCMEVIEEAFGEMHRGNAGFFDVIDFWIPTSAPPADFYRDPERRARVESGGVLAQSGGGKIPDVAFDHG